MTGLVGMRGGSWDDDVSNGQDKKSNKALSEEVQEGSEEEKKKVQLYDLTKGGVRATVGYLSDLIQIGYRHYFYMYLSGWMFYHRISFESAFEIVSSLCDVTGDEEKEDRIETLRLTYEKGLQDEPLKGGGSLVKLIESEVEEYRDNKEGLKNLFLLLLTIWSKDIALNGGPSDDGEDKKLSQKVIEMLRPWMASLFKDGSDTAFAAINTEEGRNIVPIKSKRHNLWVRKMYYQLADNTLSRETINEIAESFESEALFDGPLKKLEPRINRDPDDPLVYWYDLGDETWDAIRISAEGWCIVESGKTPIVFRRYAGQLAQVRPVRDYPPDIFHRFMKLLNIKDDSEIKLVYECYVISLVIPGIAKAIIIVEGPEGAAKTTSMDLTKSVVDPSEVTTFTPPTHEDQLPQLLQHNQIIFFDNLSSMPVWLSNALCRAATGTGNMKRELYSNDDDIIYKYKRAIGFNGIAIAADRPDLLSRSFTVDIEKVTKYREMEDDIMPKFEQLKPQLFGFVLDTLVKMLQMKANGGIKLDSISRMADFEKHCEMISRCLGNSELAFVKAYRNNKALGTQRILENSSLANTMIEFMKDRNAFTGYASILLAELVSVALNKLKIDVQKDFSWPKSASQLSRKLKVLKSCLLKAGIQVFWVDIPAENRYSINIVKVHPVQPEIAEIGSDLNSRTSPLSDTNDKESQTGATGGTGGTFANSMEKEDSGNNKIQNNDTEDFSTTKYEHKDIYFSVGNWHCPTCGLKGDKFYMESQECNG